MKLRTWILGLVALSLMASLFAIEDIKAPVPSNKISQATGINNYGAVTVESIQATGLIKLNGTFVQNSIYLVGSLLANHALIGSLEVTGEANLTDTTVQKTGFVTGSIQAVRSTFQNPITLLTQKAVFTASRLEGITFRKDAAFKGKQTLELKQGTIVNGPIVFESGKGEVLLYSDSRVLGPVTGGKIVRK
ncbi:MAG: hypothetical protein V4487_05865 [Chlamydiota bacterium]